MMGIKVLDHIIVGADRAMSMYQEGMISEEIPIHAEQMVLNLCGSEWTDYERYKRPERRSTGEGAAPCSFRSCEQRSE